ncbi:MAG: hypothetical protein EXX96DRAFT_588802 [Benjaminiella poitrasii]|nr:MAG: hypothetical protein EXX96DRAFT_588802 [Benjaminiella poitrasii]
MSFVEIIGNVHNSVSIYQWRIPCWLNYSSYCEYHSPIFYLGNLEWHLSVKKGSKDLPDYISCCLFLVGKTTGRRKYMERWFHYQIKVDNLSGSACNASIKEVIGATLFAPGGRGCGADKLARLSDLEQFLSCNGTLSITVSINESGIEKKEQDSMVPFKLLTDLLDSTEFSNVSFRVFENENTDSIYSTREENMDDKIVKAHKFFLATASPWFKILFTNGMQETEQKVINIHGVSLDVFKRLVRYCYTYKIEIADINDAYKVLEAADMFHLTQVYKSAMDVMRKEIDDENVWRVWECADKCENKETIDACVLHIGTHMISVMNSDAFLNAKAKYIQAAFHARTINRWRCNIDVEETDLYEAAVRWTRERKKESEDKTNDNVEKQLNEDVANILESTRFSLIPAKYLMENVETDDFVMSFDAFRKKFTEGYTYHRTTGAFF